MLINKSPPLCQIVLRYSKISDWNKFMWSFNAGGGRGGGTLMSFCLDHLFQCDILEYRRTIYRSGGRMFARILFIMFIIDFCRMQAYLQRSLWNISGI